MLDLFDIIYVPFIFFFFLFFFNLGWKQIKLLIFFLSNYIYINSLFFFIFFDCNNTQYQFIKTINWITNLNINYSLGLDGFSIYFFLLTTFLIPICILVSWNTIRIFIFEYFFLYIFLEILVINAFCVIDLLFFYIFFEILLIPMFLLIGIWGSRDRKLKASYFFFFFTFLGSIFMILSIFFIYSFIGSTDVIIIASYFFDIKNQIIFFFFLFFTFSIKIPIVPLHLWLPEAHVEAPTSGSIFLAGILLKLGTYGLIRFCFLLFPDACVFYSPLVNTLSIIGIFYISMIAIRQNDIKKIIAYSSISHMNYIVLGMFSFELIGLEGSIFLMMCHGLVSSALFCSIGILYDRYKTRLISYYSGIVNFMPLFSFFFFLFFCANISFPGTCSFIGEFFTLFGCFLVYKWISVLILISTFFNTVYMSLLYNKLFFKFSKSYLIYSDLIRREFFLLVIFFFLILFFGFYLLFFNYNLYFCSLYIISFLIY